MASRLLGHVEGKLRVGFKLLQNLITRTISNHLLLLISQPPLKWLSQAQRTICVGMLLEGAEHYIALILCKEDAYFLLLSSSCIASKPNSAQMCENRRKREEPLQRHTCNGR